MNREVEKKLREVFIEVYPYLHNIREVEAILNELAKLSSINEIRSHLEKLLRAVKDPILATDLKILLNKLASSR